MITCSAVATLTFVAVMLDDSEFDSDVIRTPTRSMAASFYRVERVDTDEGFYRQAHFLGTTELREHILAKLNSQNETIYYNRTWNASNPRLSSNERLLGGKIGFDKLEDVDGSTFKRETGDFVDVEQVVNDGKYTYYTH